MSGRGRGKGLTRPAWMDEPRLGPPSNPLQQSRVNAPISDWARASAADGRPYWYSLSTGATTWTDPNATPNARPPENSANSWREVNTADGRTYYFNEVTKKTQWEKPLGFGGSAGAERRAGSNVNTANDANNSTGMIQSANERRLPDGWATHRTPDGRLYYYHSATRETRWDFPGEAHTHRRSGGSDLRIDNRKRSAGEFDRSQSAPQPVNSAAAANSTTGAGSQWKEHTTADGKKYYYNIVTRETSWVRPDTGDGGAGQGNVLKRQRVEAPVSDLRQLVHRSKSMKAATKKSQKPQQTIRRPRSSDGRALTDRQAETYFLNRAKMRRNASEDENGETDDMQPEYATFHQKEASFLAMLAEQGITETSSWLETMSRCTADKRYTVLEPYGFRKHAWQKFMQKLAKTNRRKRILEERDHAQSVLAALEEAFKSEPYSVSSLDRCSPDAVRQFRADPRSRELDERKRSALIKTFFTIRSRKAEREKSQKRKDCIARMRAALQSRIDPSLRPKPTAIKDEPPPESTPNGQSRSETVITEAESNGKEEIQYFTERTPFRELERFLSSIDGSEVVDSRDRAGIIQEWRRYVEDLVLDKKAKEREERKALQKQRRANFRGGVEKLLLEGKILPTAQWKDVADSIMKEGFALPGADLDARQKDLFEDALELFDERVQRHREEFKRLLKEGKVDVQNSTTVEDLKKVEGLAAFIEKTELAIVSALLADRQRKENKRRQRELERAEEGFEDLLLGSDLKIDASFEDASKLLHDKTPFLDLQKLSGEEGLKKVFNRYAERRKSREQNRLKRKFENPGPPPIDPVAMAALEKAKRVRLAVNPMQPPLQPLQQPIQPAMQPPMQQMQQMQPMQPMQPIQPASFPVKPVPVRPAFEAENGWTAALSSKPMTEKEKLEEKERRKREILKSLEKE